MEVCSLFFTHSCTWLRCKVSVHARSSNTFSTWSLPPEPLNLIFFSRRERTFNLVLYVTEKKILYFPAYTYGCWCENNFFFFRLLLSFFCFVLFFINQKLKWVLILSLWEHEYEMPSFKRNRNHLKSIWSFFLGN